MSHPMRIMVTGYAGYIGAVLLPLLIKAGHEVIGIDAGFYDFPVLPGIKHFKQVDIRDLRMQEFERIDAVIHLAGLSNDPLGEVRPELTYEINQHAAIRLALLAREAGVKRFLFASTCRVYGRSEFSHPVTEESSPRPMTQYAISKLHTEEALATLADATFSPVFLRSADAYGLSPAFRNDLLLNNWVGCAWAQGKIPLSGDGSSWMPIMHVEDIARAFVIILTAEREAIHNQVFNIGGNSENYQMRDLAALVQHGISGSKIEFSGRDRPDLRSLQVDFSKFFHRFPHFRLIWNARLGIEELIAAYHDRKIDPQECSGPRYNRLARLTELIDKAQLDESLRWRPGFKIATKDLFLATAADSQGRSDL